MIGIEHILKNSTALKMFHTTGYDIMWTLPSYNRFEELVSKSNIQFEFLDFLFIYFLFLVKSRICTLNMMVLSNFLMKFVIQHHCVIWNRSNSFLHQAYNCDVKVAPYLWSPRFFEFVLRQLKTRRYYTNLGIAKRIGVFEPNLNFFKTSVIPIVIAELLYRFS